MTKLISILILVSAAIHVAVLGLINFNSTESVSIGTRMRISIQAPSVTQKDSPQETNRTEAADHKKSPEPTQPDTVKTITKKKLEATEVTNKTAQKSEPPEQTDPQKNTVADASPELTIDTQSTVVASLETISKDSTTPTQQALSARTSSLLYSELEQAFALHFYYPRIAVRRGWSGEVQLSLRIEANGKLSQIRIIKSSGFGLLDKAAMKSLDEVEILPSAIALLNGNSLNLVLPVEYRLL